MKLRVLHVEVKPVLVWDDGESLTPGPEMSTGTVPLSELKNLDGAIKQVIADEEENRRMEELTADTGTETPEQITE